MTTSLVTGGAGFIGRTSLNTWFEGTPGRVLDDLSGGFTKTCPPAASSFRAPFCDHELVDRLFEQQQFDYVYHLAAYAAEG